ncbi:MAG: alpha/beta hydrolase [Thiothrix sp.]|nr:MAG: alpha/beta hydrolase [Thiothrix sp.]
MLATIIDQPKTYTKAWVLFAHCFTCSKDIITARNITKALLERGYTVARFDFTGLGASEGEFSATNFSSNVSDILTVTNYLRTHYSAPTLLIGHSLGGAAILAAAANIAECQAIATINSPADPQQLMPVFEPYLNQIKNTGQAEVPVAGINFRITQQFIDDLEQQNLPKKIAQLDSPLLILHAPNDNIVDIDEARKIFVAATYPKSFIALDGADHMLKGKGDVEYAVRIIDAWVGRYTFHI